VLLRCFLCGAPARQLSASTVFPSFFDSALDPVTAVHVLAFSFFVGYNSCVISDSLRFCRYPGTFFCTARSHPQTASFSRSSGVFFSSPPPPRSEFCLPHPPRFPPPRSPARSPALVFGPSDPSRTIGCNRRTSPDRKRVVYYKTRRPRVQFAGARVLREALLITGWLFQFLWSWCILSLVYASPLTYFRIIRCTYCEISLLRSDLAYNSL
jgi:hypothetical protein